MVEEKVVSNKKVSQMPMMQCNRKMILQNELNSGKVALTKHFLIGGNGFSALISSLLFLVSIYSNTNENR